MARDTDRRTQDWDAFGDLEDELRDAIFWWLLVRGILALVFGLVMLFIPGVAAALLGIVVGLWLILDGVIVGAIAIQHQRSGRRWGLLLLGGITVILAGLAVFIVPSAIAVVGGLAVLWILAIGLAVRGVLELLDRRSGRWRNVLGLVNLMVGIVLAAVLLLNPHLALGALVVVVGIYGVVLGVFTVVTAFRARRA